jgi:hypothetical protein
MQGMDARCYGCGQSYCATDPDESRTHTHHLGDSGAFTREQILELLAQCQAERDEALTRSYGIDPRSNEAYRRARAITDAFC